MQARYQYGNLTIRERKKGPDVWQFRWMENGKPKSALIGTVDKYPKQADAERAAEHLRITINAENPQQSLHSVTVGALIDRFMEEYAPKRCRLLTQKVYRSLKALCRLIQSWQRCFWITDGESCTWWRLIFCSRATQANRGGRTASWRII
jgi:hypothetical protein